MRKVVPVLVIALAMSSAPVGSGWWAQAQSAGPTTTSNQAPPWLTIGLVVGGAIIGRYLAQRYLSEWRIVHWLAARAGAGLGSEAAGLATVL